MNIQSRQFLQAVLLLALICLLIFFFVITTQSTTELNYGDNSWYLNRARLIWQGVLPDLFVYTSAYPTFVGFIDQFLQDVLLSGMLTNALALGLILIGVYILGHWLCGNKRVAWLAVLLVVTNISILNTLRLFSATIPFTAAVIWSIIACLLVVRRPGYKTAALLGTVLALAVYTRFEGILYAIFIPLAAWGVYRQDQDRRLTILILLTAASTFTILVMPFLLNFAQVRQAMNSELSANVTGIFTLFNRTPIEWDVIWRRVTDTINGFLSHWSSLAWLVGIAGVIWVSARYRAAQWFCVALIGFNILYTFMLAIWPYSLYIVFYIPLFALILATTLDQLIRRGNQWKLITPLLCALIILPGIAAFVPLATDEPPMAYRTSDLTYTGAALDSWLQRQGLAQTSIYTFCGEVTSFSRAHFQILYRLQYTTGWDVPERLIPKMREQGALFMICGNYIPYSDWRALLEEGSPLGLHEVGRFDKFIFYRPDDL